MRMCTVDINCLFQYASCLAPTRATFGHPVAGSLGIIVGSFKSASSKLINQYRQSPGIPIWQRNYYDHVIRNESDLFEKRKYIIDNPAKWNEDEYYADNFAQPIPRQAVGHPAKIGCDYWVAGKFIRVPGVRPRAPSICWQTRTSANHKMRVSNN
jgi:hypothetical protein